MPSSSVQDFIARNEAYSHNHQPFPTVEELVTAGYPRTDTAIICCADPRSDPTQYLQLKGGKTPALSPSTMRIYLRVADAVIFRSGGAKAQNVLESLIAVDTLLGFQNVMIIQHTDCGGLRIRDAKIKEGLKQLAPNHAHEVDAMTFREIAG